jgi:hypothetical protein
MEDAPAETENLPSPASYRKKQVEDVIEVLENFSTSFPHLGSKLMQTI